MNYSYEIANLACATFHQMYPWQIWVASFWNQNERLFVRFFKIFLINRFWFLQMRGDDMYIESCRVWNSYGLLNILMHCECMIYVVYKRGRTAMGWKLVNRFIERIKRTHLIEMRVLPNGTPKVVQWKIMVMMKWLWEWW